MTNSQPLLDRFGRVHTNLRISVTDRCNIRCFYCMPEENVQFKPRSEILSFEEIVRFTECAARLGVNKLRITGGEPLVRSNLSELIRQLVAINGIEDVALTTNGLLLEDHLQELKSAGLHRLNISLDTLTEETFQRISRRPGIEKVISAIKSAIAYDFNQIRLNAIAIRGLTENEIVPLGEFAREHKLELRFIEFMPLDADDQWEHEQVLSGTEIRSQLESAFCTLEPAHRKDPSQPAIDYNFSDGRGSIGFINPVTQPFCHDCNRLRITAEGKIRNCLFSIEEWDARELLRSDADDMQIQQLIRDCVAHKKAGHGIDSTEFVKPDRAMYQIGG